VLGVSPQIVMRDWKWERAWLMKEMAGSTLRVGASRTTTHPPQLRGRGCDVVERDDMRAGGFCGTRAAACCGY
jgi:hypothetical protein